MRKVLGLILVGFVLVATGCQSKEEVKTVEWYMEDANKAALEAKLTECRNNPGELKDTPNCINAFNAQHKLFGRKPAPRNW